MLKSIIDNDHTNFQKFPDNLNLELKTTQTVKPNLKQIDMIVLIGYLRRIFGDTLVTKIEKKKISLEH